MNEFMETAIQEAKQGRQEGGIPIGSVLVKDGKILGKGHNKRVQNAGRVGSYRGTTLYSTLMPCYLCAGAVVQFGIKKVIVGESKTFPGAKEFMVSHGVDVIDLNLDECEQMMSEFIETNPELWNEDIGK